VKEILIREIDLNELLNKIGEVIEEKFKSLKDHTYKNNTTEYITRKETAHLLKISLPTLNDWTKHGWLQSYKIGNRVLYKLPEVEVALKKVSSIKHKKNLL
jgi:excisionase family DNA binding protein